ncbi:MAG: DNRLRE domain-containing protein [Ignavibacteria bacterium]|nr:DNRLRE domain-containing protein [Ignavibacteria bacterium]
MKSKLNFVFLILASALTLISFLNTSGCADDPSSLGLDFVSPSETTGVRIFDSYRDTMPISSRNVKKYFNTSNSPNLLVGRTGSYNSKSLIQFLGLSSDYDSAVVNSAVLKLKYRNYYFPTSPSDSLGQISFEIYRIEQKIDFATVTLDSINPSYFGNISQGSYTGSPATDSQEVSIQLNTALVRDWFEFTADSSYPVKNYGIVLSPNASSTVIKSFYASSTFNGSEVRPELYVIVTKNGRTDTLSYRNSSTVSLTDASINAPPERFFIQAGISYVQVMNFDLSRFPSDATINDVQLFLTLDSSNSIFSKETSFNITAKYISDTAGLVTDLYPFIGSPQGDSKYMIRLVASTQPSPFQRWLLGQNNYGIMIQAANNFINLDLFSFFNETASDPLKRPRVIIKYTPRVRP